MYWPSILPALLAVSGVYAHHFHPRHVHPRHDCRQTVKQDTTQPQTQTQTQTLATWIWDSSIITDSQKVASFLTLAHTNNVGRVFVQIDRYIQNSVWESFISQCTANNVAVEALMGMASWIQGTGTPTMQSQLDWITQFQGSASSNSKLAGIHMDVEPWALDDWENNKADYIQKLEAIVQQVVSFGKSQGLKVAADLPFWIYTLDSSSGQTLDKWMLNLLDSAVFMTYRDTPAGVEELASSVLSAGDAAGKPVMLAVEITSSDQTEGVSYYGKSASRLQSDLREIWTSSSGHSSFTGIAVHDYSAWSIMQ